MIAGLLFAAVCGLRVLVGNSEDATLVLFVVPIAFCAMQFGRRGGIGAASVALIILVGWEVADRDNLGAVGVATRGSTYFLPITRSSSRRAMPHW